MRIDIGKTQFNYAGGLATIMSAVYSFKTAVEIGSGPISLLIHFISLALLITGALLIRRAFVNSAFEYARAQAEFLRAQSERNKAQKTQTTQSNP